ncbi:MAG: substrate-binding protein [Actinomycetota bacterium]|nr:substrate-binding protein [Actinomycetota bacterium]
MRSNRLQLLTLAVVAAVSLAACGGSSNGGGSAAVPPGSSNAGSGSGAGSIKPGLKIAVLPKAVNIPYFDAAYAGAKKACDEIKAACEQIGPTQATGAAQVQFINTVIQKRYDALVISAADANSVAPALKKAQSTGVAVVTYDADVADTSARTAMVKPTTPDQIGKAQVEWIATAIGSQGGEIAILSAAATAENQNAWIGFMKEDLKSHPELKLVDTVYGDDDAAKSAEKASALLQSHPSLKGIISPTTVGVAAAAKYISGSQYKGKVQVTGLGLPSEMKAYVKDGTVKSFGLWDPGMLGYLGVYAAATKASGGNPATGLTAGGKSYTADKDGTVVVGPPQEFTADNVDQFAF